MSFAVQTVKEIFELVRDDLALVEREVAGQNAAAIEPVCEISSYLREGGGKRLRPALLLLAGLEAVEEYGSFRREPLDNTSREMIFVVRKSGSRRPGSGGVRRK